jgi:hypothetical protein
MATSGTGSSTTWPTRAAERIAPPWDGAGYPAGSIAELGDICTTTLAIAFTAMLPATSST